MKKILLSLLTLLMVSTAFADDFKITSTDPAAGECAGIAKSSYWKFATNMDEDASFLSVKYEFRDASVEGDSYLYGSTVTKADKYSATDKVWSVKNYSSTIADFKKGHTILLIISAYDNATPSQGKCLGTDTVKYIGAGSADYEYSAVTVKSVYPEPGSQIESADDNVFVITYSAPVEIDKTKTEIITGQMSTASFESIEPFNDDKSVWKLTVSSSLLKSTTPQLYLNVYVKDADGKVLEGNGNGYQKEDKSYYKYTYKCYLGSPELTVTPAAGKVESLKDFNLYYMGGINLSYTNNTPIKILKGTEEIATVALDGLTRPDDNNMQFSLAEAITATGTYTLSIPQEIFSLGTEFDGYTSKSQTVEYTIEGSALTATITPAEGTEWATMPNISVTFSDASAVGYANYVITDLNPDDPENAILQSGDLKKQDDGTWATKYLSWFDIKLYAGHTYEVSVKAYADEMDYNYSKDPLATFKSDIKGTTVGVTYSTVTYESVSPENNSTISTGEFTVKFSGAVATVNAEILSGIGASNTSCSVVPADDGNKTWKVIIPTSVLNAATGSINVNIVAKDENGLYVHGNSYADPDTTYIVTYNCYNGAPEYTITPADGSTVDKIETIVCAYSAKINPAWMGETATITDADSQTVATFTNNDVKQNADYTKATITLSTPITKEGTYTITIPAVFFTLGEEFDSCSSKEQKVTVTVGSTNGVQGLNVESGKLNAVYNLSGQRVSNAQKGIVITNGKKVVVK